MMRKLTDEDIEIIKSRKLSGETLKVIAKDYNTSGDSLSNMLRRRGVIFKNPWTREEEILLLELRKAGVPYKAISEQLNKSYDSVKRKCSDLIKEGKISYIGNNKGGITYDYPVDYLLDQIKLYKSVENTPSHIKTNVIRIFGSWTKGLEAAGIPGNIGGNFCQDRVTRVYLLKFNDFYKIGVTQQQVKSRFSGAPSYEILDVLETDLDNAVYLEKELKRVVKSFQHIPEYSWFERNGKTECFIPPCRINSLEEIFEL